MWLIKREQHKWLPPETTLQDECSICAPITLPISTANLKAHVMMCRGREKLGECCSSCQSMSMSMQNKFSWLMSFLLCNPSHCWVASCWQEGCHLFSSGQGSCEITCMHHVWLDHPHSDGRMAQRTSEIFRIPNVTVLHNKRVVSQRKLMLCQPWHWLAARTVHSASLVDRLNNQCCRATTPSLLLLSKSSTVDMCARHIQLTANFGYLTCRKMHHMPNFGMVLLHCSARVRAHLSFSVVHCRYIFNNTNCATLTRYC